MGQQYEKKLKQLSASMQSIALHLLSSFDFTPYKAAWIIQRPLRFVNYYTSVWDEETLKLQTTLMKFHCLTVRERFFTSSDGEKKKRAALSLTKQTTWSLPPHLQPLLYSTAKNATNSSEKAIKQKQMQLNMSRSGCLPLFSVFLWAGLCRELSSPAAPQRAASPLCLAPTASRGRLWERVYVCVGVCVCQSSPLAGYC